MVVTYWIFVKRLPVDQELDAITLKVHLNVSVHLEPLEIRTKKVAIHRSNVKLMKTVLQQHTVFKLMVFRNVKTTVKK